MRPAWWLALGWAARAAAAPVLPATPLEPAYHALFSGDRAGAWRQLDALGAGLSSAAQRQAWLQLQRELVSGQCGRDMPLAPPPWLEELELDLIQRDIPLSRIYSVRLSGASSRRDLQWSLRLPDGRVLLAGNAARYQGRRFELDSDEQAAALPPGVYRLTVQSGGQAWRQDLSLSGAAALDWLRRDGRRLEPRPPAQPSACPRPWLEQALLSQPDFELKWWRRRELGQPLSWPAGKGGQPLWASVSLLRAEFRGAVAVRQVHRLAAPWRQF
ncbi:DUF2861 family protein [Chromobacterium sphagni]|uniref:DUF2861 family protein n=1 Tax=Chromobacterium sphagni TaxID=1903179 RepID=UPI0009F6B69E|nr:DUF2861 family protein [Chromobacterium sphagni]